MSCNCKAEVEMLKLRMDALEMHHSQIDRLIDLLESVESALNLFVKLGNAFKWLTGLGLAIGAAVVAIKQWFLHG